jgi:hypothetical protein
MTTVLSQNSWNNVWAIGSGVGHARYGERLNNFPASTISRIDVALGCPAQGSGSYPTGMAYLRIRDAVTDAILGTLGSLDVSTIPQGLTNWYTFSGSVTIPSQRDIRILVEYDSSPQNYITSFENTTDVFADGMLAYSDSAGHYTDDTGQEFVWQNLMYDEAQMPVIPVQPTITTAPTSQGPSLAPVLGVAAALLGILGIVIASKKRRSR